MTIGELREYLKDRPADNEVKVVFNGSDKDAIPINEIVSDETETIIYL